MTGSKESARAAGLRERLEVVLVSPRNPLNIGAAARAMANFGFARLSVVAPYDAHWREAQSAVGADDLLGAAQQVQTLQEAVAGCTLVLGTGSLERRNPEQTVLSLPRLAVPVARELSSGGRAALVFGQEKRGLTRQDLALCHALVAIPTSPRQPSMNLGQAVAVCLYELSTRLFEQTADADWQSGAAAAQLPERRTAGASAARLEMLEAVIEETMTEARYSPRASHASNNHDLKLLLRRLALDEQDARRILRLFRRILWRFSHVREEN